MGCQQPKAVNKGWRDLMSEPCGDDSVVGPRSLPAFLSLGSVPNPCCQHLLPEPAPGQRVTAGGSHVCLGPRPTDAAHRGQGRPVRHEGNASSLLGPRELRQTCRDTGRGTGPGHLLR